MRKQHFLFLLNDNVLNVSSGGEKKKKSLYTKRPHLATHNALVYGILLRCNIFLFKNVLAMID